MRIYILYIYIFMNMYTRTHSLKEISTKIQLVCIDCIESTWCQLLISAGHQPAPRNKAPQVAGSFVFFDGLLVVNSDE